jgi:Zn-dependent M16 (insulinase) family peptidase
MIQIANRLLRIINYRIYYLQMAGIQSNFDFISSYCEPTFSVEKYQSNKTGMKLYHINVPLPLIKLEICVQTRPYDDTGCPHTLGKLFI